MSLAAVVAAVLAAIAVPGVSVPVDAEWSPPSVVVSAIPPKAPASPVWYPEPEPVAVEPPTVVRPPRVPEPATQPQQRRTAERVRPAPAPPTAPAPSEHDRALALAAEYGCGSVPVVAGGTHGNAGYYSFTDGTIYYAPGDRNLRYIMGHECSHARQQWAYGGDAGAMQVALESVGGFEKVADCMSQFLGAGSGYYTSSCGGARGEAASELLRGERYVP